MGAWTPKRACGKMQSSFLKSIYKNETSKKYPKPLKILFGKQKIHQHSCCMLKT